MAARKVTETKRIKPEVIELPTIEKSPTLKKGTKEAGYVTLLQLNLKNRGYYDGPVDGKFGDETEKAVMGFQKDCKKPQNGIVGAKTWELLKNSKVMRMAVPAEEARPVQFTSQPTPGVKVLIEGLTRYQADLLLKLLQGHTECRIL